MTSTMQERILAKSWPQSRGVPPDSIYLHQHTLDVIEAVEALFGTAAKATRLGECWLRFFKIADDSFPTFIKSTRAAAAFHDWGKANSGFQDAVRRKGEQLIRHEHLSGLFMELPRLREWFEKSDGVCWDSALASVVSHHLKISEQTVGEKLTEGAHFRVDSQHDDFQHLIQITAECLELEATACPNLPLLWTFHDDLPPVVQEVKPLRKQLADRLGDIDRRVADDETNDNKNKQRMLQAVRSALLAADAAGSATVRISGGHTAWIKKIFNPSTILDGAKIDSDVIGPRIAELKKLDKWDSNRGVNGWSEFQLACATKPDRTLLLAPCGAGKTLAAWKWIEAQLSAKPASRVIFLYPTRATATEGFRDYVSWAPEASLLHGTAAYELEGLFENPRDPEDFRKLRRYEPDQRLFAIGYWEKQIFSATVDQFFAFLQHSYSPSCLLPVLADSVIVVDEVHSFDKRMFSALKQFLKEFDIPVLCMTATLPEALVKELVDPDEIGLSLCNEKPGELQAIAERPRYRIRRSNVDEAKAAVVDALGGGKKVLWVSNTVDRAQNLAGDESLKKAGRVICYHSRFKLDDRKQRHQEVVFAFKQSNRQGGVLALSTQVCEMSLDLDADILVTEAPTPIPALIQRMGRTARDNSPKSKRIADVYVIEAPNALPYNAEQLTGCEQFLDDVTRGGRICSQQDLEEALQEHSPEESTIDRACQFFASGPYALAGEDTFRDISEEFTVPGVLDIELEKYVDSSSALKPGFILPFPLSLALEHDSRLPKFVRVAPSQFYSTDLGFRKPAKTKERDN